MAKKAATPTTVTLKHLAAAIAEDQERSKKKAEEILSDLVGRITKHLKKGERIRIVGLGILQVRSRAARMGRNPATGEAIEIKASKKVAFRAAQELKEAIGPRRPRSIIVRHCGPVTRPRMALFIVESVASTPPHLSVCP